MTGIVKLRTQAEIEDEAAAWVWRLDSDSTSAADRREFSAWLQLDPRNRRAFDELGGVWNALDALAEAKRDEKVATFSQPPVSPAPAGTWRVPAALAAVLALVLVGAFVWLHRAGEAQTIATAVGQHRVVTLVDGSVVTLNTNTIVRTRITRDRRDVDLLKGEAYFAVKKDPARPFRVHAGGAVVRAVGTEFTVWMREPRDIQVVVAEGRVRVLAPPENDHVEPRAGSVSQLPVVRELSAGQLLAMSDGVPSVAPIDGEHLARVLAWRDGAVVFDGESLSEALNVLNRYTEVRFVVTDPRVADLRVGGRFRTDDVDQMLNALQAVLPVSIRKEGNGLIYIDPRR